MNKKFPYSFLTVAFFTAIVIVAVFWNNFYGVKVSVAQSTAVPVMGAAWSDNIGWIIFNPSTNPRVNSNCTSADCGVFYNPSTGQLSGYAWSDNIGWIKFQNLSADNEIGGESARVDGSNVLGWARACAGTADGECNSMTSRTDGWDGWIKMSGDNNSNWTGQGVKLDLINGLTYGDFSGWAWGDDVVGWISFNCSNEPGGCTEENNHKVEMDLPTPLSVSCSASHTSQTVGKGVTFTAIVKGGLSPYTYVWSGDADFTPSDTTQIVTKSYSSKKTINAIVTVSDQSGQSDQSEGNTCSVEITDSNIIVPPSSSSRPKINIIEI